jgi:Dyp-type peroxidase family
LDLNNVQGDILAGLPKMTEAFVFFQIDEQRINEFRRQLARLVPLITSNTQVLNDLEKIAQNKKSAAERNVVLPLLKMSGVNLAFTHKGLVKMGIKDEIGDSAFDAGMLADAQNLGDQGTTPSSGAFTPDWIPAFKHDIHGLILISGDCHATVDEKLAEIKKIFLVGTCHASIHEMLRIDGDVRPGSEKGHEHFGYLDGISQPAVQGVNTNPNPGQETVRQGIVLLGREGDAPNVPNVTTRPPWALDGSFLSFRYLFQLVPEFDEFKRQNSIPGVPPELSSELLGARLVGRWKSGAPVDVTPTQDDPALGADPSRNNNFRFDFPDDQQTQDRCPFAAHIRKTNPRADLEDLAPPKGPISTETRRIIRQGIPFGPEVSADEAALQMTLLPRGLLFVAYQSNIVNGFQFLQHTWANNDAFPPGKPVKLPGFDPIIGQASNPSSRTLSGTDPSSQSTELALPAQWVVPKGGEYFFSPSIPALKATFALAGSSPHHEL